VEIERQRQAGLKSAHVSPYEFAEYLYQLEKVCLLAAELENNRFFPQEVYDQMMEKPTNS